MAVNAPNESIIIVLTAALARSQMPAVTQPNQMRRAQQQGQGVVADANEVFRTRMITRDRCFTSFSARSLFLEEEVGPGESKITTKKTDLRSSLRTLH